MCPHPERDGTESPCQQHQQDSATELRRLYRRLEELEALAQVAWVTSQSLEADQVAQASLTKVLAIAQTAMGFILGVDPEGKTHLLASCGLGEELRSRLLSLRASSADVDGPMRDIDSMAVLFNLGQALKGILTSSGYTSHIIAPITARSGPLGLLVVVDPSPDAFASRSVDAMAQIGKQVGMALENARLYELSRSRAEALARRSRQLSAILQTTERVVLEEDLGVALRTVASGLVNALDEVDGVILWLWDEDAGVLRPAAFDIPQFQEDLTALLPGQELRLGEGPVGQAFATGQVIRLTGLSYLRERMDVFSPQVRPLVKRFLAEGGRGLSRIITPLTVGGKIMGCLDLMGLRSDMQLTDEDVPVMQTFANQVAAAIQKARLLEQIAHQLEELKRSQEQLIASARLRTVVELARGLAHEVNNALTLVLNASQMARSEELSPRVSLLLKAIESGSRRIQHLVQRFSDFAPPGERSLELGNLNAEVEDALALLSYRFDEAGIRVSQELDPELPPVRGDLSLLGYAITNLLLNAVEAMPDGGCLTVRTWLEDQQVALAVTDTGRGIPEENLSRIFEPSFTTKVEEGRLRGLGLGLFAASNIVAAHGGEIQVDSQIGVGSTFTIRLPAVEQRS